VIPILGDMMRMPGLPETPAAENIDLTDEGRIVGLF
jgi:formate--tetrahydrofolate ligase